MQSEKLGGLPVSPRRICNYLNYMNSCNMLDLGYSDPKFTWYCYRESGSLIQQRLDWAWANPAWRAWFPEAVVKHLPCLYSDHNPILIKLHESIMRGQWPFRLEPMWCEHPAFPSVVDSCFNNITTHHPEDIIVFQEKAQEWNRDVFGNLFKKKKRILAQLEGTQRALGLRPSSSLLTLESQLRNELYDILRWEEIFWATKSREN